MIIKVIDYEKADEETAKVGVECRRICFQTREGYEFCLYEAPEPVEKDKIVFQSSIYPLAIFPQATNFILIEIGKEKKRK